MLLLEELAVEQGNLLAVRVGEAPQRRLVRVVQLRQEVTLLEMEKRNYAFIISSNQGGSNGFKKCDLENPKVRRNIIGQKMNFKNRQYHHID